MAGGIIPRPVVPGEFNYVDAPPPVAPGFPATPKDSALDAPLTMPNDTSLFNNYGDFGMGCADHHQLEASEAIRALVNLQMPTDPWYMPAFYTGSPSQTNALGSSFPTGQLQNMYSMPGPSSRAAQTNDFDFLMNGAPKGYNQLASSSANAQVAANRFLLQPYEWPGLYTGSSGAVNAQTSTQASASFSQDAVPTANDCFSSLHPPVQLPFN